MDKLKTKANEKTIILFKSFNDYDFDEQLCLSKVSCAEFQT